jgi:sugar lactone lactonase YvrE
MKRLIRSVTILLALLIALAVAVRFVFGGGTRLEDRTGAPSLPASAIELVVDLDYPPGNIAVSPRGRVFFTLHPDGNPPTKVLELVDGRPVPYPSEEFQRPSPLHLHFETILSLRIDRQNRLWVLDYGNFGIEQPRLLAFDLGEDKLVYRHDFDSKVAGFLSMLNDFQVAPDGRRIYIAETSPIIQTPALIVHDTVTRKSRRLLHRDPSVMAKDYIIQAPGRDMIIFGLITLRIGVDSIALDRQGEWLYYGPVNGDRLYRIATKDLNDESLNAADLAARVEDYGPKTLSDGLTTDVNGYIYLSDMEHSAVVTLGPDRQLSTVIKDPRLRWPDGFTFAPDGWLYVTCSSLQHVLFVSESHMRAHAPYQIYRFKPGREGVPGH